jgi:hypothetical protein
MKTVATAAVIVALLAATAAPSSRGGAAASCRGSARTPYDGAFMFCRSCSAIASNGDSRMVLAARADQNLSFRFSELTTTQVSRDIAGNFNHVVIQLTDADRLAKCPFIMITEPGGAYFDEAEAAGLRTYLQKGGFLWADDFWGEYAWAHWENEIRKALPSGQYPLMELPLEHPLFHVLYDVHEKVQIPSIGAWGGPGGNTSERRDSAGSTCEASPTATVTCWWS